MRQHLAQGLIHLRRFSLASQAVDKLCFDHAECSLYIAPLVILGRFVQSPGIQESTNSGIAQKRKSHSWQKL